MAVDAAASTAKMEDSTMLITHEKRPLRKTAGALVLGFAALMVALTFFSRTLNNLALARVKLAAPSAATLQKVISADGVFQARQTVTVNAPAAGEIQELRVQAGDVVKAGDVLAVMDTGDLADQLAAEQRSLERLQNNRDKAALTVAPDYTQQNVALSQAKDKRSRDKAALSAAKKAVERDEDAVDRAKAALEKAKAEGGDTAAAQAALDAAKQKLAEDSAQVDTLTAQVRADEDAVKVATAQLNQQKKQNASQEDSRQLELENMDLEIAAQKDKIAGLQSDLAAAGEVKAPVSGRVLSVNAQEGAQISSSQPMLTMMDAGQGLQFSVEMSYENAELLSPGVQVDVLPGGASQRVAATLREKRESDERPGERMTLLFDADAQGVAASSALPGQHGDIRYSQKTQSYATTVPNSALREDSAGTYVLVSRQRKTPLGNRNELERVDVAVLDSDNFRTAVSGPLNTMDSVVTAADKPVDSGDAVLVAP